MTNAIANWFRNRISAELLIHTNYETKILRNCKSFVNSEVIFGFNDENYPRKKKLMSLRQLWNFRKFRNFRDFWDFEWPFWPNGQKYWQFFFVIFNQDNVLFILVEFESDQMSPRESPKNGRIGDYGLNCIFLILSSYLKSTMKITLEKQISRLYHTFEIFVI